MIVQIYVSDVKDEELNDVLGKQTEPSGTTPMHIDQGEIKAYYSDGNETAFTFDGQYYITCTTPFAEFEELMQKYYKLF